MKETLYLILIIFLFSGCAPLRHEKAPRVQVSEAPHAVSVENLTITDESRAPSGPEGVELTWKVPDTAVDGFIIHFGYSPDNLLYEIVVEESELRIFDDARHGLVFRYTIEGVDRRRDLHIAITAFEGSSVSASSDVIRVAAEQTN